MINNKYGLDEDLLAVIFGGLGKTNKSMGNIHRFYAEYNVILCIP